MEKETATHSSILAWKSHGHRSLVGCSPWSRKESGTTEGLTLNTGCKTEDGFDRPALCDEGQALRSLA